MGVCADCGHPLGVGRFCVNCGRRVDQPPAPDDTAERPAARVSLSGGLPAPVVEPPPQPRYPLFADDPAAPTPASRPRVGTPAEPATRAPVRPRAATGLPTRRRADGASWLPWAIGVTALVLIAMVGTLLLLTDDDEADDPAGISEDAVTKTAPERESSPATKRNRPRKRAEKPAAAAEPVDLTRYASATAPATAPPNQDVTGGLVRYDAANMVDLVPETCWRMPGSGGGEQIVLTFRAPVVLTRVGLINGYAKTSGSFDWYHGNRRVLEVEWVFDDGTAVRQRLGDTRSLQSRSIKPVTTTAVTLRLLDVSPPGGGRSGRDYTAISDVSMVGAPA